MNFFPLLTHPFRFFVSHHEIYFDKTRTTGWYGFYHFTMLFQRRARRRLAKPLQRSIMPPPIPMAGRPTL